MATMGLLAALFGSAFVSATLLPGNSEVGLLYLIKVRPELCVLSVVVATLGNTLGGLTTVWLGQRLPQMPEGRSARWAQRYGPAILALSWLPVIGDGLCAVAGWLRWPWRAVACWIVLGKAARYAVLAWLAYRLL